LGVGRFLKNVKNFTVVIVAASLVACTSHKGPNWITGAEQSHRWGFYSAPPITRWEPDGRNMTLISELRYTDPQGVVWIAPAGSVVDGASIPRSLWSIMGGPFEGRYRNASILHDVAYDEHNRPWEDCDRMFYNAMRCSGVNAAEAKTMYYALYKFGHHWKVSIKKAKRVKPSELAAQTEEFPRAIPVSSAQIDQARDWIRSADPTLEEIEQRADAENH
jgi:endonuclease G